MSGEQMHKNVRAELALAAVVAGLGVLLLAGVGGIGLGAGYDQVGPRFFPYAVAAGLLLLGALVAWAALGQRRTDLKETSKEHVGFGNGNCLPEETRSTSVIIDPDAEGGETQPGAGAEESAAGEDTGAAKVDKMVEVAKVEWKPLGWIALALALNLALLERAGFMIAAAVQFWLVARAFHSTKPARDAVVAVGLSVVVYYAFSEGLGLSLPPGILRGIF